jgi:hypothetical protein
MVVVIGNPTARRTNDAVGAGGLPVAAASAAVVAGATVQLVGRVGEGADGDAVVLAIAEAGIGHAALLRGPTPVPGATDDEGELVGSLDELAGLGGDDRSSGEPPPQIPSPGLDAADLVLGLRYLSDYRVVVVADPLAGDALAAVVDAAGWADARLVVVTDAKRQVSGVPADATVLEAPDEGADGAFAALVGRYAAALDSGTEPADAFAMASGAAGWSPVEAE